MQSSSETTSSLEEKKVPLAVDQTALAQIQREMFSLHYLRQRAIRAHYAGGVAKERGFMRVSPYYEDELAESLWLAGFDGKKFEDVFRVGDPCPAPKEQTNATPVTRATENPESCAPASA